MTDEDKIAEIARKMAEIVAEAHRLAAESEAVFRDIQMLDPKTYVNAVFRDIQKMNSQDFAPSLRLIQGGQEDGNETD